MIKHLKIIVIFICCPFIWPLVQLSLCITGHYPKMRIPGNFPRCLLNKDDTVLRIGMELLSSHLLVSSVLLPAGANIASFISAGAGELTRVFSHIGEEIWFIYLVTKEHTDGHIRLCDFSYIKIFISPHSD